MDHNAHGTLDVAFDMPASLHKCDIIEIACLVRPPLALGVVFEAACSLLAGGGTTECNRKLLKRSDFLQMLVDIDEGDIDPDAMNKLRTVYMRQLDLKVMRKICKAGLAVEGYDKAKRLQAQHQPWQRHLGAAISTGVVTPGHSSDGVSQCNPARQDR